MIYEKLNHRLIFIILSQLFFLVNRIVYGQYIPGPRLGCQTVSIKSKAYYIGGVNFNKGVVENSDVFYLDNGAELGNTGLQPWVNLEDQVKIPFIIWHSVGLGGANQDSIFITGGVLVNDTASLVYQFDTQTNAVSSPTIGGTTPTRRRDMGAVSYQGKIYLFSGRIINVDGTDTFFNNFDILNTITMTWEVGSLVNAPTPRFSYTATLVNGVIYYIGGTQQGQFEQMSNIYLYDIASNTWSLKTATSTGILPQNRVCHTAVYYNGTIYIYGGHTETFAAAQGTMALLDITTLQWSIPPQIINLNVQQFDTLPKLTCHTATSGGKFMFLFFGNVTDNSPNPVPIVNSDYSYLFHLEDLRWMRMSLNGDGNPKVPGPPKSPTNTTNTNPTSVLTTPTISASVVSVIVQQPLNSILIISLSVGLAVVGLGAIAAILFIYKRINIKNKPQDKELNNDDNDVGIPGESSATDQTNHAAAKST